MTSPSTPTAITNCVVGVRYCSSPSMDSGMRLAAAAKNASGTTVIMPVPASSRDMRTPPAPNSAVPPTASHISVANAAGASTAVSPASDRAGGRSMCFLM